MPFGGKGDPGASIVFRGWYDSTKTYRGTGQFLEIVQYAIDELYYISRTDAGEFSDKAPTDTNYWNLFGGSFENVATNLIFSKVGIIGGWLIKDGVMESQRQATTSILGKKYPVAILDGSFGSITFYKRRTFIFGNEPNLTSLEYVEVTELCSGDGLKISGLHIKSALSSDQFRLWDDSWNKSEFCVKSVANRAQTGSSLEILMKGLPTSATGLTGEQLWRDGNTLKITSPTSTPPSVSTFSASLVIPAQSCITRPAPSGMSGYSGNFEIYLDGTSKGTDGSWSIYSQDYRMYMGLGYTTPVSLGDFNKSATEIAVTLSVKTTYPAGSTLNLSETVTWNYEIFNAATGQGVEAKEVTATAHYGVISFAIPVPANVPDSIRIEIDPPQTDTYRFYIN
jgi:hypothetical protein